MMNPRPVGRRKVIQVMVAVFILVWATQTLLIQWGYGAVIIPADMKRPSSSVGATLVSPAFSPGEQRAMQASPLLEVRADAKIDGSEITLRNVCRWHREDDEVLAPLADVVVARVGQNLPVRQIDLATIKKSLKDAGANLSALHFSGSATCAVRRSDVDDETFIRMLKQMKEEAANPTKQAENGENIVAEPRQTPLRDLLVTDLCDRLKIDPAHIQVTFDPRDEPTLILGEPRCKFEIDSTGAKGLGEVTWEVVIRTDSTERRATIVAKALAWENEVVLNRPLSKGQTIITNDVREQRVLVTKPTAGAIARRDDAVGRSAARDFERGDVIAAGDLKNPTVVHTGQFVTVSLAREGQATIDTVARAMDDGARGDSIRARNEATGEIYTVLVTGNAAGQITETHKDIASTN